MLRGIVRTPLRLLLLLLLVVLPQHVQLFATAQVLSAQFTPCLRSASQAPPDQLLNISRVYAQWDNGQQSPGQMVGGGMNAEDNANGQALLRLVALAETGVQSEGFSNETNYLATLIVETSILSFIPYSNQSSLCSSIITAGESLVSENNNISALSFPNPGGCPYGPGPVLIGYEIPLGSIGLDDYYPLSTLSTRLRILDTSVPPLQLACVDVYTTPSYTATSAEGVSDASDTVFTLLLWLPVAVLIAYIVANVIARFYASWSTVKRDREAAIAASLNDAKAAASRSFVAQARSVMLEFAVGRSIVRSRSLTRFATPGVGDVLGTFQWIAMVGMCSVIWQGFAYPIFSRLGWSMLVFNTTILTPTEDHTDPTYSSDRYPPSVFQFNSEDLFTDQNSPFYFSQRQVHSNLLNIPSTGRYNSTRVTSAEFYPSENELQGLASFSAILGFRPQDLFANSMIFFAFLLAATVLFTFILPVALVTILRAVRGKPKAGSGLYASPTAGEGHSRSSSRDDGVDGPVGDLTAIQLAKHRFNALTGGSGSGNGRGSRGADTTVSEDTGERSFAKISGKHLGSDEPFGGPDSPAAHTGYLESLRSPSRQQHGQSGHRQGINRWWAGGDKEQRHAAQAQQDAYYEGNDSASTSDVHRSSAVLYSVASWYSFCLGSIARLLLFFHLPITIFSVYTMSHANRTSSAIEVAFATIVFLVFSIGLPIFFVLRIRRTMTRYLQDDTNTLLAYGPLYNTFAQDSYTFSAVRFTANLVEACVVGGSQNRATVQAAVILAVEIIETLITSIWLPWGEGAAQGPLQFIMSVTRIITAVLLIVISPAVRMSFTARGWIGYVIILVQALVVVLLLLVLVCKLVELVFRLIGRVEFDESRNPKAGGLLGAFRKKGVLGFKRRNTQRHRRPKNRSGDSGQRTHYPQQQRKSGLGYDESQQTSTAVQGGPRPSQATYRSHRSQVFFGDGDGYFNASVPVQPQQQRRPMRYLQEHDEDDEYIMSAFRSRPASMGHAHDGFADPGYVAPGSYSAPPGHQGPPIPSPTSPGSVGSGGGGAGAGVFQVIRGGRATDQSPYALAGSAGTREQNMSLPPGAAGYPSGAAGTAPGVQMGDRDVTDRNRPGQHRARAASQSAVVEFFNTDGEVSPGVTSLTSGEQYAQPYRNTGAAYFAHGASGAATNGVSAAERESRRLSAPLPTSPMSASRPSSSRRPMSMGGDGAVPPLAWRTSSSNAVGTASGSGHGHGQHQGSSSGHGNGFFTSLFKGGSRTGKEGDDWTDSDDSDDDEGRGTGGKKGKRRWPFVSSRGKQQRVGRTSATEGERVPLETMRGEDEEQEALDEEAAWAAAGTDGEGDDDADGETSAPTTGKSFVVIRKPMNQNQPR